MKILLILVIGMISLSIVSGFKFQNSSKIVKDNITLFSKSCNKDTQIDFAFSSASEYVNCTTNGCTTANSKISTLQFLDAYATNLSYSLVSMEYTNQTTLDPANSAWCLRFQNGNRVVIVEIPLTNNQTVSKNNQNVLDLRSSTAAANGLTGLAQFIGGSKKLSGLNNLNLLDFGHFYTVTMQKDNIFYTLLTSSWIYYYSTLPNITATSRNVTLDAYNQIYSIPNSGDKLCYGALRLGVFQTHMRQSYPLWGLWIFLLTFWIYNLITEPNTMDCYDKQFQNNKWTSWAFYSLHYVGHQQFFTKLSRSTSLLLSFSWQACVLACIYGTLGHKYDPSIIIWSAVVAYGASIPFPWFFGCLFLKPTNNLVINKYEILKRSKQILNKQSLHNLQQQVDKIQQSLYGYYYWYYILCFVMFVTFWIVSIHMMVWLPRQFYNRHQFWLASLAIAFALQNLIFDPLFTLLFGSKSFYQSRGHFYDYRLGQLHKAISD